MACFCYYRAKGWGVKETDVRVVQCTNVQLMKYFLSGYQLLYAIPSSLSKAKKKPKMVRKMTMLLVKTSPHDAHVIVGAPTGALAKTIGKAKADKTMPVVKNAQTSFKADDSLRLSVYRREMSVGIGDNR